MLPRLTMAAAELPEAAIKLLLLLLVVLVLLMELEAGRKPLLLVPLVPNLDAPAPDDVVVAVLPLRLEARDGVVVVLEPEEDDGAGKESVASRGTARFTSTVRPSSTWRSTAHT